jgi:hypothetical protein
MSLSFNVLDKFNLMNKTATFGVLPEQLTANADCLPGFSTAVAAEDLGKPILRHFYSRSPDPDKNSEFISTSYFQMMPDVDKGYRRAICVSYTTDASGTDNRKWVCGSLKYNASTNGSFVQPTLGTVTAEENVTYGGNSSVLIDTSSPTNLRAGMEIDAGLTESIYAYRTGVTSTTPPYTTYDVDVYGGTGTYDVGVTVFSPYSYFSVIIVRRNQNPENSSPCFFLSRSWYTVAIDTDTGIIKLTFDDDFESNVDGASYFWDDYTSQTPGFHPSEYDVYYKFIASDTELTHAKALKNIIEASGLTTNAASFTAADSALSASVCFSIPFSADGDLGTYADYAAKILESTGGYLRINESDEVEYKLFAAPSPSETLTNADYANLITDVEYQDIYTTIDARNETAITGKLTDISERTSFDTLTQTNEEAYAILGSRRIKYIQHVLTSMSNSIARVLDLVSNRRMRFKFKTATENIDTSIGDDYYIQSDNINNGTAVAVKVVSKSVSVTGTEVEAIDLYGV